MRQVYEYHSTIGFRFVPGLSSRVPHEGGGYLIRTNATGFRCRHEFDTAKPVGRRRVLLFGDSFTAGEGVSDGYRYGDHLEKLLPDTDVYNFGLPATGTDQQYLIYQEYAGGIEHDLIVLGVFVENIRRVASRFRYFLNDVGERVLYAKPYYTVEDGRLVLHGVPPPKQPLQEGDLSPGQRGQVFKTARFPRLRNAFFRFAERPAVRRVLLDRGVKERIQKLTRYQPVTEYKNPRHPAWVTMKAIITEWITRHSRPVMVVPIPLYHYVAELSDPSYYQRRLSDATREAGGIFFDPLPGLVRHSRQERRSFYFENDNHLTRAGHEALARVLAPAVDSALAHGLQRHASWVAHTVTRAAHKGRRYIGPPTGYAMSKTVLGISAFYHDSAASIVRDGEIVAAAQEERFSRKKHDPRFPRHAVNYCLEAAAIEADDLDAIVFYDNPLLTWDRVLHNCLYAGRGGLEHFEKAARSILGVKLWVNDYVKRAIGSLGRAGRVLFTEHHLSHAASAFYPSPFEEAAILTIDGVGEWCTTAIGHGKGNQIELLQEIDYPHSLGLLYSAITYFCGFRVNSGEYKLMGLAPYGRPKYVDLIRKHLIDVKDDGSYRLDTSYFGYIDGLTMTNDRFHDLFGGPPREPESRITRREMDIAASIQAVTNEVMLRLGRHARKVTGARHLVLAGGVALNCVANGHLLREGVFDDLWIQPAAGDAGGSLGAALMVSHGYFAQPRRRNPSGRDMQRGSYLGPDYNLAEIKAFLHRHDYPYEHVPDADDRARRIAKALADGRVVGYFAGRMEFGPRALGARSILGDPRKAETQTVMNLKIKYRESFRPFAPSVLAEDVGEFFELDRESPYMLLVAPVQERRRLPFDARAFEGGDDDLLEVVRLARSDLPAITHVDYSARVQTVHRDDKPDYWRVIYEFKKLTGYGVIVNTSFNVRGEPIVMSPKDAYTCLMRTEIDLLVLEECLLWKQHQPKFTDREDWKKEYGND